MKKLPKEHSRVIVCVSNDLEMAYFRDEKFYLEDNQIVSTENIAFWFYEKDVKKMLKKDIKKKELKSLQKYAAKLILEGKKERGWGILYATNIIVSDPGDEQSHIYLPKNNLDV